ncbi:NAD(P)H-binding protein, partial [Aquiflexum sp.]|uniref:NAD(P)H-binding protein n=1 Tax=Aquiflexum sp. TaxID=1872584 RepID=UPI003593D172
MGDSSLHTILGSTGNIGTSLAKDLTAFTANIRLVSRNPKTIMGNEELVIADFLNEEAVDKAIAGSGTVYLVAGITYRIKIWREQWPIIMGNVIKA